MAKKPRINKTQIVRDYLEAHPGAMPTEIADALLQQGIKMTRMHVSAIKTKLTKTGTAKKAAKKPAPVAEAPAVVEKPTNGSTITLEHVKKVAHTIQMLGGIQRVTEVLAVIKDLGGVKKFRDLAEAMTVTEMDEIPY
jgi:hypothetical protein